jgi:hypothetical protein
VKAPAPAGGAKKLRFYGFYVQQFRIQKNIGFKLKLAKLLWIQGSLAALSGAAGPFWTF